MHFDSYRDEAGLLFTDPSGCSVFGGVTESHGRIPAFFTSQHAAEQFRDSMAEPIRASLTFGRMTSETDLRRFLAFNEQAYLILDGVPTTVVDLHQRLNT
jgi:hypothetical protein